MVSGCGSRSNTDEQRVVQYVRENCVGLSGGGVVPSGAAPKNCGPTLASFWDLSIPETKADVL